MIANTEDKWFFMNRKGTHLDTTKIKVKKDVTKGFPYIDKSRKINFIDSTDYLLKPWQWAKDFDFIYHPDYYANLLDPMPDIPIYDTWKQNYKGNFDVIKELPDIGLTLAKNDNKYGLVDKMSNIVLPFEYDRIILPFDYEKITPFDDGYAYVEKNNKVGTIDKNGKIVIPVKYDNITFYHHKKRGLIKVQNMD